jgi:DNA-directed RNA polymerase subunit M/transcription elongation factor TFIIS
MGLLTTLVGEIVEDAVRGVVRGAVQGAVRGAFSRKKQEKHTPLPYVPVLKQEPIKEHLNRGGTKMDEYYCPNCRAILNLQFGFDPSGGTWTCSKCGELLMDDDVYEGDSFKGVAWFCDGCGSFLNRQSGFSDSLGSWVCTDCGHRNGITADDILA